MGVRLRLSDPEFAESLRNFLERRECAVDAAGLSPDFVPHILRGWAASVLNDLGAVDTTVQRFARHGDLSTTHRVYIHPVEETLAAAADLYDPLALPEEAHENGAETGTP